MARMVRLLLLLLLRLAYRLQVVGREHLPCAGGALLVANHVSFVDALILSAATPRPVRFLMHKSFFRVPLVGWFARKMGTIAVAAEDSSSAKRSALLQAAAAARAGELVCIFAEGAITRSGSLQAFRRGLERIAREADVPIIPVALDRLWGSIFSYEGGRAFWKLPRAIPYPVDVRFGEPLPAQTPAWQVRLSVAAQLAQARRTQSEAGETLGLRFLRTARRYARHEALIDASGQRLSYRKLSAAAIALGRRLRSLGLDSTARVGILLPPSAGGVLGNLALSLYGVIPVNLNATLENEELRAMLQRAGAKTLLTSRQYLAALGRQSPLAEVETLYVEDLRQGLGRSALVRAWCMTFLPARWLARLLGCASDPRQLATILFSSGSTGVAKGIELSHANVLANVRSILQWIHLAPGDNVLGILPFFHSFGFTVTLWTVLSAGARGVYAPNPLDGQRIAELCRLEQVTVIAATPSFLQAWTRRFEPASVAGVRLCLVGAEKLRPALAQTWRERFGLEVLEGYGCTELAPVVALSLANTKVADTLVERSREGSVGLPLPGVAVRIVSADSGALLGPGEEGQIEVESPARMRGYLDDPEASAQCLHDGWYRTGDLGKLDEEGFLYITDRQARFSKIAGEMVSHGRVEALLLDLLARLTPPGSLLPTELAVTSRPDEHRGEALCVLHTPLAIPQQALLDALSNSDLPRIFRPRAANFIEVTVLPKTASGKTDLAALKRLVREPEGTGKRLATERTL